MNEYIALWNIGNVTRGEIITLSDQEAERLLRLGAVKPIAPAKAATKAEPELSAAEEKPEAAEDAEEAGEELPELTVADELIREEEAPAPKTRKRRNSK